MRKVIIGVIVLLLLTPMYGCAKPITIRHDKGVVASALEPINENPAEDIIVIKQEIHSVNVTREYEEGYDFDFIPSSGVGTRGMTITDLYPGINFVVPFPILNGGDGDKVVEYSIRIPEYWELRDKENQPIPEEYFAWFGVTSGQKNVVANSVTEIAIPVAIPEDAEIIEGVYEVKAKAVDVTGVKNIFVQPEVTWYIDISD